VTEPTLRKYSRYKYINNYLRTGELNFSDVSRWDDMNDRFMLDLYQRKTGSKPWPICFTRSHETYHHWRIYAYEDDGLCIEFDEKTVKKYTTEQGYLFRAVSYHTIERAQKEERIADNDIPFIKRHAFKPEGEMRVIASSPPNDNSHPHLELPLDAVSRIIFGPNIQTNDCKALTKKIRSFNNTSHIELVPTKLLNHNRFQSIIRQKIFPK